MHSISFSSTFYRNSTLDSIIYQSAQMNILCVQVYGLSLEIVQRSTLDIDYKQVIIHNANLIKCLSDFFVPLFSVNFIGQP